MLFKYFIFFHNLNTVGRVTLYAWQLSRGIWDLRAIIAVKQYNGCLPLARG